MTSRTTIINNMQWVLTPPQRYPQVRQTASDIVGLIPYISNLINDDTNIVNIGSIQLIEQYGEVYLAKFQVIRRPDPILPFVGLNWEKDKQYFRLRNAYQHMSYALGVYGNRFLEEFNYGAQIILDICYNATKCGKMTNREYRYVSNHLTRIANNPQMYR